MTTSQLTEQQAQMKEAARELLQMTDALGIDPEMRFSRAGAALMTLLYGDTCNTGQLFSAVQLVMEVAKEEGLN